MTKERMKWQLDTVRVLIEEAKVRNGLDEKSLAKILGISTSTLAEWKNNPEKITMGKLMIILSATKKELKCVEE